jgi:hypothetical protein
MWRISEDHCKIAGRSHNDAAFGRIDRIEIGHEKRGAWIDARNTAPDRLSVGCLIANLPHVRDRRGGRAQERRDRENGPPDFSKTSGDRFRHLRPPKAGTFHPHLYMRDPNEELARRAKNFSERSDQSQNQRTMGQSRVSWSSISEDMHIAFSGFRLIPISRVVHRNYFRSVRYQSETQNAKRFRLLDQLDILNPDGVG